eukprot:678102-Amphidinium_carterae.1
MYAHTRRSLQSRSRQTRLTSLLAPSRAVVDYVLLVLYRFATVNADIAYLEVLEGGIELHASLIPKQHSEPLYEPRFDSAHQAQAA